MVGNSHSPSPSSRAREALEDVGARIQDMWDHRTSIRPETVRRAGVLAVIAAAAAALLILPQPDDDPAVEAYALQALADPSSDGRSQAVTEPTFEVADQTVETNQLESWTADNEALAAFELSMFRQRAATTVAPTTTEAPTTTAPPTTAAPVTTTTAAPTTESDAETTEASQPETSADEETTASSTDDSSTDTSETTGSTDSDGTKTTDTTVEETTTTAVPTTADNGFVDAGHGVYVPPILLEIRYCESRDNYQAANPSSSARGAYQFLTGSWEAYGHAARYGVSQAHLATNAQQDEAALITWQRDGTRPWNASKHCWG